MKISSHFAERDLNLEGLKFKSAFETVITVREWEMSPISVFKGVL